MFLKIYEFIIMCCINNRATYTIWDFNWIKSFKYVRLNIIQWIPFQNKVNDIPRKLIHRMINSGDKKINVIGGKHIKLKLGYGSKNFFFILSWGINLFKGYKYFRKLNLILEAYLQHIWNISFLASNCFLK